MSSIFPILNNYGKELVDIIYDEQPDKHNVELVFTDGWKLCLLMYKDGGKWFIWTYAGEPKENLGVRNINV